MMRRKEHLLAALFCVASLVPLLRGAQPPNIIVLLADDLGYADVGANGCRDIPTPHIDSLARDGVRFTSGYATHPVCSPSRAGLLSGMYQHRFGFEHNSGPERFAADTFGLPREIPTLAERLKALGYATGMVGKWHVGFKQGLRPWERGFDFFFGFLSGAHTYLPGRRDSGPILRNGVEVAEKEYLTDAFAREAVAFVERCAAVPPAGGGPRPPFFLYVAFNAVHAPLEATAEDESRFPGITDSRRKTYAGMLAAMDDAVGRVLARLRELGLDDNTLVFFYSDNGGPTAQTTSRNDPLRGGKGQVYEGGIRVPFLARWPGRLPAGAVYAEPVMAFDIHATALRAAGGVLPTDRPLDGVDLLPFLGGSAPGRPHEALFWRAGDQHAARLGDWKLVQPRGVAAQLFHLRDDIGERTDLAAREPAQLARLHAAHAEWEEGTVPARWRRQDARTQGRAGAPQAPAPAAPPAGGASAPRASRVESELNRLDLDGDGRLSRAEAQSLRFFDEVDTNKDGFLTRAEVRTYLRDRLRGRPRARPEAAPSPPPATPGPIPPGQHPLENEAGTYGDRATGPGPPHP